MFWTGFLSIIRSLILCTQQYIQVMLPSIQHHLYDIYLLLGVQYYTPDDGQKTCPNHVESFPKINLRN
jgi:hypothetical protein